MKEVLYESQHHVMATSFALWLRGEDGRQLQALSRMAWQELDRIECMLSRFKPNAEIARINREAPTRWVRIERELFGVLQDCQNWHRITLGYFNICRHKDDLHQMPARDFFIQFNQADCSVRLNEAIFLDLGGYGKGYAIDRLIALIREYGIEHAFLHGGTSSAFALGRKSPQEQWPIKLPHAQGPNGGSLIHLQSQGFSFSGVQSSTNAQSSIFNPVKREMLLQPGACYVIANTALEAEVLSTACLAMGPKTAEQFSAECSSIDFEMHWHSPTSSKIFSL